MWVLRAISVRTISPFYHLQYSTKNHINHLGPGLLYLCDFKLSSSVLIFIFHNSHVFLSQNHQTTLFLCTKAYVSECLFPAPQSLLCTLQIPMLRKVPFLTIQEPLWQSLPPSETLTDGTEALSRWVILSLIWLFSHLINNPDLD